LVILARRYEKLLEIKEEIEKDYSVKVYPIKCDITSTEDINNAAELAEKEF
jgi:short-subunit dehydrogenase